MDTTRVDARREAEGSNGHLLDGDELVIDGMRFLGATPWTDFELAIETPEGPISAVGRAMKMATSLLNDYTLIRTVDESAEPDTWRDKQGRKLQAQTRCGFIRRSGPGCATGLRNRSPGRRW